MRVVVGEHRGIQQWLDYSPGLGQVVSMEVSDCPNDLKIIFLDEFSVGFKKMLGFWS